MQRLAPLVLFLGLPVVAAANPFAAVIGPRGSVSVRLGPSDDAPTRSTQQARTKRSSDPIDDLESYRRIKLAPISLGATQPRFEFRARAAHCYAVAVWLGPGATSKPRPFVYFHPREVLGDDQDIKSYVEARSTRPGEAPEPAYSFCATRNQTMKFAGGSFYGQGGAHLEILEKAVTKEQAERRAFTDGQANGSIRITTGTCDACRSEERRCEQGGSGYERCHRQRQLCERRNHCP